MEARHNPEQLGRTSNALKRFAETVTLLPERMGSSWDELTLATPVEHNLLPGSVTWPAVSARLIKERSNNCGLTSRIMPLPFAQMKVVQ